MSDIPVAVGLGRLIAEFGSAAVPEHDAEIARKCLVDTVGVMLAGSAEREDRKSVV